MAAHLPADRALFVLSLAPDDPERVAAFAHAADCPECRQLLTHDQGLLEALDRELSESADLQLSPGLEARVRASLAPAQRPRWVMPAFGLGAVLSFVLAWLDARPAAALDLPAGGLCFLYEQVFALAAFGLGALFAPRYARIDSAWSAAIVSMSGALVGQCVLLWRCEAHGAGLHLLIFHVFGVAAATLAGAWLGPRFVKSRA